jgi:phage terminase large subunit-like protein
MRHAPSELDRFCSFAGRFLTDEQGAALVIEGFQREILADYFAGTRELVVIIPKKCGNTSLFAALALWHAISVRFADVAVLAASRDQAGKLLGQLTGYIKRNPSLRERLRITQRVVHCEQTEGKVAVLASDADTLDGWGGTLALIDELARHKSEQNFGLLRDGLGPRDGQLVAFSTAGDDESSVLGRLRARAHAMPAFERDAENPKHKRLRSPEFCFHEWSLDPGDDTDDLDQVLLVNPASWIDRAELEKRRGSPSMQDWQWQRFTCGWWVAGEQSVFSSKEWAACARPGCEIPAGAKGVYIGLDLGLKHDCSAFVPCWRDPEGTIIVHEPAVLTPPGDGTSLPFEDLRGVADEMAARWDCPQFVFDPSGAGEQLAQWIEGSLDADVTAHPQSHTPMCAAAARLASAIAERKLAHPEDEELTKHVLSAAAKSVWGGEQWRIVKPRGSAAKVDAAVALAMGVSASLVGDQRPSFAVAFV